MARDLVRLRCGATGIDVGHGWGLYVCAQDNDLGMDRINPDAEPWDRSPVPTPAEVDAAEVAVSALSAASR